MGRHGTAVMVFASLTSLALQWKTAVRSFTLFARGGATGAPAGDLQQQMAAIEVPTSWLVAGVLPIAIALLVLQIVSFSIHW